KWIVVYAKFLTPNPFFSRSAPKNHLKERIVNILIGIDFHANKIQYFHSSKTSVFYRLPYPRYVT
ncbi:MAG: hypothetical protein ACN4ES_11750, partial [Cellulophaga baltica]